MISLSVPEHFVEFYNIIKRGISMEERKKPNQPHNRYIKIGIWIVLSALILAGLAIIVGVAFDEIGGEQASIEEIVYLPQQHDYSRGTSTLSYSMAARYSDGYVGSLPEIDGVIVQTPDLLEEGMPEEEQTRAGPDEGDSWSFTYKGSSEEFKFQVGGIYQLEVWGAQGGPTGGKGGYSKGKLEVTKDQTLNIYVGGKGQNRNGGWNG